MMTVGEKDQDTMRLVPKTLNPVKPDLTMFTIIQQSLVYRKIGTTESGVKMVIVLQRKVMSELLTTYLPTLMLMLITYATTFFKKTYFEAAVGTNLTTMLVMTTIFIGKAETLPTTAYVKHIDIWLIMGQLIPFIEVIIITLQEFLIEESSIKKYNTTNDQMPILRQGIIPVPLPSVGGSTTLNLYG